MADLAKGSQPVMDRGVAGLVHQTRVGPEQSNIKYSKIFQNIPEYSEIFQNISEYSGIFDLLPGTYCSAQAK